MLSDHDNDTGDMDITQVVAFIHCMSWKMTQDFIAMTNVLLDRDLDYVLLKGFYFYITIINMTHLQFCIHSYWKQKWNDI